MLAVQYKRQRTCYNNHFLEIWSMFFYFYFHGLPQTAFEPSQLFRVRNTAERGAADADWASAQVTEFLQQIFLQTYLQFLQIHTHTHTHTHLFVQSYYPKTLSQTNQRRDGLQRRITASRAHVG